MAKSKTPTEVINGITYYHTRIELPPDKDGKRKRKKIRAKTVKELNQKIEQFKNEQKLGINNQDKLFGELFKEWLYTIHTIGMKGSTKELYERLERLYITTSPLYGIKIKNLSDIDIQNFYNNSNITPYLKQSIHRLLNPFYKYLYEKKLTVFDLSRLVKAPKYETEKDVEIFSKAQQEAFINECNNCPRYKNALLFALYTGIRIGELEALTWNDFKDNKITINKTFRFVKNLDTEKYEPLVSTPKTKSSIRTLVLNNKALEVLNSQERQYKLLKMKLGDKFPHPELIFTNIHGNYLEPRTIRKALEDVCLNANLPKIKFHALRHTYASRLIEAGINIKVISTLLGHASTSVTEKVYLHVLEELKEDTNNLINQVF